MAYHLLKSGHEEFFDSWRENDVAAIGWANVADHVPEADRETLKSAVRTEYPEDDPANAAGALLRFVDRGGQNPVQSGDTLIIAGSASVRGKGVIRGVAEVGEVKVRNGPLDDNCPYRVVREVTNWKYEAGPVARTALSDEFQEGGEYSTRIRGTLKHWDAPQSALSELVTELENTQTIAPKTYNFGYEEKVVQAHIRDHIERFQRDAEIKSDEFEKEYATPDGKFADFLFFSEGEQITVVEVKLDTPSVGAVTQLQQYIQQIDNDRPESVSGILLAEEFDDVEGLTQAIGDDDIKLMRFSVGLEYEDVLTGESV